MRSLASAVAVVVVMAFGAPAASAQTTDDEDDSQATFEMDAKAKAGGKAKAKGKAKGKAKDDKDAKAKAKAKEDEKAGAAAAKGGGTTGFEAGAEMGASGEGEDSASAGFTSTGEEENPTAPRTGDEEDQPVVTTAKVAPEPRGPYPIQYVMRPNVLPKRMTEVTLDLPNKFNKYMQSFVLGAHHGVTDQLELGLRYNIGTFTEGGDGVDNEFFTGKTVAIDAEYGIFSWLSAQLSIPMLFDPFSSAATLGAPMKFELFEKLSFELGRDFFTFRINRLIPSVDNAALTEALVVAEETGTDVPAAMFTFQGAATYQHKDNMAIQARAGQTAFVDSDDTTDANPLLFDLGLYYSTSNKLDFGGRIGWSDINNGDETFGIYAFAAARF